MTLTMNDRWNQLWTASGFNITEEQKRSLFGNIMRNYSGLGRAYHMLPHIEHCLVEFEVARLLAENPSAVAFALWYHDIVYDPRRQDNESVSALVLSFVMAEIKAPVTFTSQVVEHIHATKHDGVAKKPDSKLVVDIDLSILGQPEDVFDEYEDQVRFEYSWVPEETFRKARAAILQQFLERPTIYQTKYFQDKYEQQARVNLTGSIQKLQLE
jgi:predicted metal-dependent HD superfamily phosphohydrolase